MSSIFDLKFSNLAPWHLLSHRPNSSYFIFHPIFTSIVNFEFLARIFSAQDPTDFSQITLFDFSNLAVNLLFLTSFYRITFPYANFFQFGILAHLLGNGYLLPGMLCSFVFFGIFHYILSFFLLFHLELDLIYEFNHLFISTSLAKKGEMKDPMSDRFRLSVFFGLR